MALDAGAIAELLAAAQGGAEVALTLCGDRAAHTYTPQSRGAVARLQRLFKRPSLKPVLEAL